MREPDKVSPFTEELLRWTERSMIELYAKAVTTQYNGDIAVTWVEILDDWGNGIGFTPRVVTTIEAGNRHIVVGTTIWSELTMDEIRANDTVYNDY